MPEKIRVGLVGCGGIAQAHIAQYPEIPEGQLVGFYDLYRESAESSRVKYEATLTKYRDEAREQGDDAAITVYEENIGKLQVYGDYGSLLRDVDVVDICVPPPEHLPVALEALALDRSVMVEKPMARTWWETVGLDEAVKHSKGLYQHNENWIFNPLFQRIRNLIESGVIGDVQRVIVSAPNVGPQPFHSFWRCDPYVAGGGSLTDWGIHCIGAGWYLVGLDKRPIKVRSASTKVKQRHRILGGRLQALRVEDDSWVEILLEDTERQSWSTVFAGGTWSSQSAGDPTEVRVEGSKGEIWLEGSTLFGSSATLKVKVRPFGEETVEIAPRKQTFIRESFLNELRNFVLCAQQNTSSMVDHRVGAELTAIVGAAYFSEAQGGRAVGLEEFKKWNTALGQEYSPDEVVRKIIDALMAPFQRGGEQP